jgi:hypothetical protein
MLARTDPELHRIMLRVAAEAGQRLPERGWSDVPAWWPPEVGDQLLEIGGPAVADDRPLVIIAVAYHDGGYKVVTAGQYIDNDDRRRWAYRVHGVSAALVGLIRPKGAPRK